MEESIKNVACTGKAKHDTYEAARKQMVAGKNKNKCVTKDLKLSVYLCKFCGFYHVGNTPKRKK